MTRVDGLYAGLWSPGIIRDDDSALVRARRRALSEHRRRESEVRGILSPSAPLGPLPYKRDFYRRLAALAPCPPLAREQIEIDRNRRRAEQWRTRLKLRSEE